MHRARAGEQAINVYVTQGPFHCIFMWLKVLRNFLLSDIAQLQQLTLKSCSVDNRVNEE